MCTCPLLRCPIRRSFPVELQCSVPLSISLPFFRSQFRRQNVAAASSSQRERFDWEGRSSCKRGIFKQSSWCWEEGSVQCLWRWQDSFQERSSEPAPEQSSAWGGDKAWRSSPQGELQWGLYLGLAATPRQCFFLPTQVPIPTGLRPTLALPGTCCESFTESPGLPALPVACL